ncbi:hypothetical protein OKR31_18680 [Clostridioides difficile]|nr:hypothetical protein [Clostridioides difficile]
MFIQFNQFLGNYINIISLMSSFVAVAALIISVRAFINSNKKARVILKYRGNNKYNLAGDYCEDNKGCIKLCSELVDNSSTFYAKIDSDSLVDFTIENRSTIVAKSPILSLRFVNIQVNFNENEFLKQIDEVIIWQPRDNTTIHKGIDFKVNQFNFSGCYVNQKDVYVEVILSADNMETKKFKIPIKLVLPKQTNKQQIKRW